ncbi:putative G-type lectin S-receptor-like serine/threonine-protein [Vigna angularis]|uniref:Putative G-type lectin S-receptor-like serine/threonine-protein n=1 Tax=Phaseolus angularis TaxID=3914 RepID=A0A8T0JX30_PHAAN|nr:putative G-type lectin S-receptor-like serine/threonine-protein [Vigna angularis]
MSFFSRLCPCFCKGAATSGDGGDHHDDHSGPADSLDLIFDLHTLQLATNFFSSLNQLGHGGFGPVFKAWSLYQGGRIMELIDPTLGKYNGDEAAMCIQLGLLCCQASIIERPDMNAVHLMISSDSFTLPRPGKPGIQGRTGRWTTTTSALTNTNASNTTRVSGGSGSFVEDYSRNSISTSSFDEGR